MVEVNSIKKWTPAIIVCKHCGQEFIQKQPRQLMFCSKKCGQKHHYANNTERYKALPSQQPRHCAVVFCTCKVCGNGFVSNRNQTICGDECRKQEARIKERDRNKSKHGTKACNCKICGNVFFPEYGTKKRKFCSVECETEQLRKYRRMMKSSRRARIRATEIQQIDPLDVLSRDNWTCQICGTVTPKSLRGSIEDNAPEVDHIIPLAFSGGHTWDNLQCACRSCNQRKGATNPDKMLVYSMAWGGGLSF